MIAQSLTLSLRILLGIVAGRLITRITRPELLRPVATGMLCGFQLFCLLPTAAELCENIIWIPSFVLGLILSIFLKECTPRDLYVIAGGQLFCMGLTVGCGVLRLPFLLYGLGLGAKCKGWLLPILFGAGMLLSILWQPSSRVCGMLLAVTLGAMLKTCHPSALWVSGLTAALMASAF